MSDAESVEILVREAISPDGRFHVQLFAGGPYPFLRCRACAAGTEWIFWFGRDSDTADKIAFRWDLPNGSWGIFIDGECWALIAHRPAQRMNKYNLINRCAGRGELPITDEEIRFACAKRRGQWPGTHGYVIEE